MTTTIQFGVSVPGKNQPVPIAYKSIGEKNIIYSFTNPIAQLLDDDTPLIPMDHSTQETKTIGEFRTAALREIAANIIKESKLKP